ncbi:MAG: hypothetical protein GY815_03050 [Gammaproteobacteria bacterium]|nr:hypothetical protein [Gammaproteobacteria bacterium]
MISSPDFEFDQFLEKLQSSYRNPVLVFNLKVVKQRIQALQTLGNQSNCTFLYALKSFGDEHLIRFFAESNIGFDVSNLAELNSIQNALEKRNIPCPFISATGPLAHEVSGSKDVDVINAASIGQYHRVCQDAATSVSVGLRIKCDPMHRYNANGDESRFGIDDNSLLGATSSGLPVKALHIHQSGKKKLENIKNLARTIKLYSDKNLHCFEVINLGGGFYDLSIEEIEDAVVDIRKIIPDNVMLVFEPGNYWFENAGYALGKVVDISEDRKGKPLITLDLSKECHLKWSDPQPIDWICGSDSRIAFYGSTCREGDHIGEFCFSDVDEVTSELQIGETVCFKNISIYSASWNIEFNGIPKAEVIFFGG